jgi:hypothetical protein
MYNLFSVYAKFPNSAIFIITMNKNALCIAYTKQQLKETCIYSRAFFALYPCEAGHAIKFTP